jgi:hypothetical protein
MFRFLQCIFFSLILVSAMASRAFSEDTDPLVRESILHDEFRQETGVWRTRVQHVFDERSLNLLARAYSVFDPVPSRDLTFLWTPDDPNTDRSGRISGDGRLVWRSKGLSPNDPVAIYSVYVGHMRDGKPNGLGRYVNRDNLVYDGSWRNGRFDGSGTLQLSSGEFYEGKFSRGRAIGFGKYIDITGEIFEGYFVDGLRQGTGKTTLPGGSIYQSTWKAGSEVPGSKRIRLAELGTSPSLMTVDDVRLGVTVETKPIRESLPAAESLGYTGKPMDNKMVVKPDDAQLVSVWKDHGIIQSKVNALKDETGMYRQSLFGFDRNALYPPKLAFDFQNKSAAQIEIKSFYLDVATSETETQPALDLSVASERETCGHAFSTGKGAKNGNFAPYFAMNNFGWAAVEDATLRFDFVNPNETNSSPKPRFTKQVGTFQKRTKIDVADAIAQAGGNIDLLRKFGTDGFACDINSETSEGDKARNPSQCLDKLKTSGAFGTLSQSISLDGIDVVTGLRGTLEYHYRDPSGKVVSTSSPLQISIAIGGLTKGPECGEGGPPQPIRNHPISLKLDQASYRIQLPVPTSAIAPGHSRQFTLAFSAPKSSHHDFQLVAVLTDGREIRSRPITLLYFVPSWYQQPLY